ncbi:FAD-binding oxidoreductase [Sulfobacillus sp. hq2]|uniref:FAD-binding oxidoreductase n=1 Tax=Sulfobacillus TaxID=28033 RepID=UPI000CD16A81|nr:FAD-linked oxidase C-terminal domain-containing protein [Sulfobacillus sp. hq2]POB09613.1 2-hydroxy-acid oxidase [Sulfobacillus sp. hq2]
MTWIDELIEIVGPDGLSTGESVKAQHARDFSYHHGHQPDVVVFPTNARQVSRIMQVAYRYQIPVIAYGQGTGVEGHTIPLQSGITIDFANMNRVVAVRPEDFVVQVEPGITRQALNKILGPYGLFFPVDPGADASLGGMASTNAAGTEALRYGAMRQHVLGLEVVLADGRVMRLGGPTMKSSAGYQLTSLFVGAEGTLGILTELTLKVYAIPQLTVAARAVFNTIEDAGEAATEMIMHGVAANRLELMDEQTIHAVNVVEGTEFPEQPTLFLELAGNHHNALLEDLETCRSVASDHGTSDWTVEWDADRRQALWHARHKAALDILAASGGSHPFTTDTAVPLSALPRALRHARETLNRMGIQGAVLGHVGDGNYHIVMGINPEDPHQLDQARAVNEAVIRYAWEQGGTCTGEHGIGMGKTRFLREERGESSALYWLIKDALDPHNLLNPGKTIPRRD